MRARSAVLAVAALIIGVVMGSMLNPRPTGAVSKEIIQLQEDVSQLLQGQQTMRSTIDANNASMRTLVQQSLDSVNALNQQMATLQKNVQEATANSSSRIDTMSTQTQGISDNLQDVQARVGKVAAQINDMQSTLQSIDGRLAGGSAPSGVPAGGAPGGGANGSGVPPSAGGPGSATPPNGGGGLSSLPGVSSDTLYQNALRDFTTGKYDLARQEFGDYVLHFPSTDLASNAQFYLGEISYAQADYKDAIAQYNLVLANYPQSYKLAAALLKKGFAELEMGMKATGTKDLRELVRRFPGADEARRAQAKLKEIGATTAVPRTSPH
ncbi:MAG: tol-pal system protein YbgF [Candidatus Acidiferrales bacterium]|jgi:tol-pal system protein YbgF